MPLDLINLFAGICPDLIEISSFSQKLSVKNSSIGISFKNYLLINEFKQIINYFNSFKYATIKIVSKII